MSDPEDKVALPGEPTWERKLLEKIALEAVREQRARRKWGIFFKFAGLAYLLLLLFLFFDWGESGTVGDGKHTAVIHVHGVIEPSGEGSAHNINEALQAAFKDAATVGVILRINSPGGSPVQAGIVHDEVRRLRAEYPQVPLYVVVEDLCASGGYYIAVAADKIFVDKASIVGSIGVLMDGFGFTGTMDKLGVERRLLTAGENKGFLDPFSPQDEKQKAHAQVLLGEIHRQFIEVVRKGRGQRLKETPEMFTGLMWTGTQSIQLGLTDGLGTVSSVARDVIKAEKLVDFTVKDSLAERLAKRLRAESGLGVGNALMGDMGKLVVR